MFTFFTVFPGHTASHKLTYLEGLCKELLRHTDLLPFHEGGSAGCQVMSSL